MCHSCSKAPRFEEGQIVILLYILLFIDSVLFLHISLGQHSTYHLRSSTDKSNYVSPARMGDVCDGGKARTMGATQDGDMPVREN